MNCPNCQKKVRVDESAAGKRIRCGACQHVFVANIGAAEERPIEVAPVQPAAVVANVPETSIQAAGAKPVSSKGDFIGQGRKYEYGAEEIKVTAVPRGVKVKAQEWTLNLGAPQGQSLAVREYPGARRFAFSYGSPGIDFQGNGRGSNRIAGEFVVWELEISDGRVVRLAIDFTQRSEEKGPPLRGKLRLNSTFE